MKCKFIGILFLLLWVGFGIVGYRARKPTVTTAATPERTFQVHGQIRGLDERESIMRIAHDEIPGYMPAMTMPLAVKDRNLFKGIAVGDQVQFELAVTSDDSWISHLEKISGGVAGAVPGLAEIRDAAANELKPGEKVPDFTLTDQDGKAVNLTDFRGKILVVTFIYTRCPLPNYCPLMSKNFAALQDRLGQNFAGQFSLLSISIDPKFDRPEILKDYASRWDAHERVWRFATGDEDQINFVAGLFGLVHEPEGGLISHNLRTALITGDGKLLHVWKSNVWTPYEVERMIGESLSKGQNYSAAR